MNQSDIACTPHLKINLNTLLFNLKLLHVYL